jgi:hypothetical protein
LVCFTPDKFISGVTLVDLKTCFPILLGEKVFAFTSPLPTPHEAFFASLTDYQQLSTGTPRAIEIRGARGYLEAK